MENLKKFSKLKCSKKDLRLDITLKCGQSFRWKQLPNSTKNNLVYYGVLKHRLWLLSQDENYLLYQCVGKEKNSINVNSDEETLTNELRDYFQLDVNLYHLYSQWAKTDPIFNRISQDYPGVRMLRQDPVENLFSFICSANNNISRISGMVDKLCTEYGKSVTEWNGETHYAFPELEELARPEVEGRLRELGFGYRAKYIQQSADKLINLGGEQWLYNLRSVGYVEAKKSLLQLSGVGPKVADCILLMSLDQPSSIPVDTHMFTIAKRYLPHLAQYKTVTDKVYQEIGDHFRTLYGEYAGWAHSVLFSADLKHLQDVKTENDVKLKQTEIVDNKEIIPIFNSSVKLEETLPNNIKEEIQSNLEVPLIKVSSKRKKDKWVTKSPVKLVKKEF